MERMTEVTLPMGSSPRVRGEVNAERADAGLEGIIPAGAGRSAVGPGGCMRPPDHPRGCGEKALHTRRRISFRGSSPRVRGEEITLKGDFGAVGIIPAGAGRRASSLPDPARAGDHPRGCGEKSPAPSSRPPSRGSSPRVRGEVVSKRRVVGLCGIIPAGAGRRLGR